MPDIADLLRRAAHGPAGLVLEGEAGIGKTTLWLEAVDRARADGVTVLAARGASAELTLTYSALADLLTGLDVEVFTALPDIQRQTLRRVLPGADGGPPADERAVAAAFLAAVEHLARDRRVMLAIDDAQWLDPASHTVIGYAVRRLAGPVAVLATVRTPASSPSDHGRLTLPRPELLVRRTVAGLTLGAMHRMFTKRLNRTFARPTMTRIHRTSGGNPFYALELAYAVLRDGTDRQLPESLATLVAERIGRLDQPVTDALLLTAACVRPQVDRIARAADLTPTGLFALLEPAEDQGVITVTGNSIEFTHPLLASGVYANATPAQLRSAHQRLAEVVDSPELRARHLALSSAGADPDTLAALDAAAMVTASQGAPATAAELLELALDRGGDSSVRRIICANHHFAAGEIDQALLLVAGVVERTPSGPLRASALLLLGGISVVADGFGVASSWLRQGIEETTDPGILARLYMMLSFTEMSVGEFAEAERVLTVAETLTGDFGNATRSHVHSLQTMLGCLRGAGINPDRRRRALELEDLDAPAPIVFRASSNEMQLRFWEGDLGGADRLLRQLWRRSAERGAEGELLFFAVQGTLIASWRGDLVTATETARDATERADQLGGENSRLIAGLARGIAAAHAGRVEDMRSAWAEVSVIAERLDAVRLKRVLAGYLGMLEVSLGRYPEAVQVLGPCITDFRSAPHNVEIHAAAFVPDAVEALVAVDRLDEAEPLVMALEAGGARLDRLWARAEGARCRALLLAARGDLDGAEAAARRALAEHETLALRFVRARTLLSYGQIQRRCRRRRAAAQILGDALREFETMGAQAWAQRTRDELARLTERRPVAAGLTPAERRVAERAAAGMSNKEIAAALFISPKTVEMNLSSVYRKLGIRSRSQLHAGLGPGA